MSTKCIILGIPCLVAGPTFCPATKTPDGVSASLFQVRDLATTRPDPVKTRNTSNN